MRFHSSLQINLEYLKSNLNQIRSIAKNCEILFMVKANAYGHGAVEIVEYAFNQAAVKEFGVATLGEALYLREKLPQLNFDLYVFSDLEMRSSDNYRHYVDKKIIPVLSNMKDLDFFLEHEDLRYIPLCLKFNTGMNRLGFLPNEVDMISNKLKKRK